MEPFPDELNRKLNLSQWILEFDKHLLSHPKFYDSVKEYYFESYKKCSNLRKAFHNEFLPKLDDNLGFPSSKSFYKYEYFFKPLKYPKYNLSNIVTYDDDLKLCKNNSLSNLTQNKINENLNIGKNINDENEEQSNSNNNKEKKEDININNRNNKENKNSNKNVSFRYYNPKDSKKNMIREINLFDNKNKKSNDKLLKKKSYLTNSNYSSRKELSSIKGNNKNMDNENEDNKESEESLTNINLETFGKEITDESNINLETYGKEITDKDELSESKSKIFDTSNKSLKKIDNNGGSKEIKKNNGITMIKLNKPYVSRSFKNLGNIENIENNNKEYKEDNQFKKSSKKININKKEENNDNKNNKKNKININSKLKYSHSNYNLFKKLSHWK